MYDKHIFLPVPSWTTDGVSLCCVPCDGSSSPNCHFYFPTDFRASSTFRRCQRLLQFSEYCLLLGAIVRHATEMHIISLYLPGLFRLQFLPAWEQTACSRGGILRHRLWLLFDFLGHSHAPFNCHSLSIFDIVRRVWVTWGFFISDSIFCSFCF